MRFLALAVLCLLPSQCFGGFLLNKWDVVKFTRGVGGANSGGAFEVHRLDSATNTWTSLGTVFCVERDENISLSNNNTTYKYFVGDVDTDIAAMGGVNTNYGDALSAASKFIHRSFVDSGSGLRTFFNSAYSGLSTTARETAFANGVQRAIWNLEEESPPSNSTVQGYANKIMEYVNAQNLSSASNLAYISDVKVLNIFKYMSSTDSRFNTYKALIDQFDSSNSNTWKGNSKKLLRDNMAQSQAFFDPTPPPPGSPVPEPTTMTLFGLGALAAGFIRARKKSA